MRPPNTTHRLSAQSPNKTIGISYVLGHVVPLAISPEMDPLSKQSAAISSVANASTQMLSWVFPAGRTDPVLHLAYWHIRLLSELLSPDRKQRPLNILQATKNMIGILAGNHDLLNPITHHFGTLAALALAELQRFADTREEAARLAKDVLEYSIAPSPWNAAVREKLAEQQQQLLLARPGTAGGAAGDVSATSRNLRQLADLATAVDGAVTAAAAAAAAAAGDGSAKEELLGAVVENGAAAAVQAVEVGGVKLDENGDEGGDVVALPDVRALLRNGYLTCFEEPEDEMVV